MAFGFLFNGKNREAMTNQKRAGNKERLSSQSKDREFASCVDLLLDSFKPSK
jgi:hypothetical protein